MVVVLFVALWADKSLPLLRLSVILVYIRCHFLVSRIIKPRFCRFVMLLWPQITPNKAKIADKSGFFPDLSAIQARIS